MNKMVFLLTFFILSSCSIRDFKSNIIFNEIYEGPKIKFLEPSPNSVIQDDVIPLSFQISNPTGIKCANITYADQEKKYSYNSIQYPTTVTINEHLPVSNNGLVLVSIRAVTGKNTESITNIHYNMEITTTYFTAHYQKSTSLPITFVELEFLPTSAPPSRILVTGPLDTTEIIAPSGGFGRKYRISNLGVNVGNNNFTVVVNSIYGRISRYTFTVYRI